MILKENKENIRNYTLPRLTEFIVSAGAKPFNAKQVYKWLWERGCNSFALMSDLPKQLRTKLEEHFYIDRSVVDLSQKSNDGTIKVRFRFSDGVFAEGVLIPSRKRMTACISSQAGCALGCKFCASGDQGFTRDLSAGEIIDQVHLINKLAEEKYGTHLSNIVYMGMGEPLLNYDSVVRSINELTDPNGRGMSAQRITVSTIGIPEGIIKLANDLPGIQLAVSLHSADDSLRSRLMPANKKYPLETLTEALKTYHQITGNRISIEYLMLAGVNDSVGDALKLTKWTKNFPVKINLIPYNEVEGKEFRSSRSVDIFKEEVEKRNLVVNIRVSKGADIKAACGQLINQKKGD